MTFLPIVDRELRVTARRRSIYRVRLAVALTAMVVAGFILLVNLGAPQHQLGRHVFVGLSVLCMIYCLFSGRISTADCLSSEKREGTLGLLFLTDLRGYDVVIGKMAANSINAFYGILAVLPIFGVPLLMGGITLGEFGRMALLAVNALFFSLSLGICMSAFSRSGRKSATMTFLLLLLIAGVLPAIGGYRMYLTNSNTFPPPFF